MSVKNFPENENGAARIKIKFSILFLSKIQMIWSSSAQNDIL